MRRTRAVLVGTAAVLLLASGCSDDEPSAEPTSEAPSPSATLSSPTESPSESPSESPTSSSATAQPGSLTWKPVSGSTDDTATVSGKWTLTRTEDGSRATLAGPRSHTFEPAAGYHVDEVLIDGQFAVAVTQHDQEQKPSVAQVYDLATGKSSTLDGDSEIPTTTGGPWALGSGILVHATTQGRTYCLAFVDLLAGRQDMGPCVPPRHGITNVTMTPSGAAAMTFDAGRPSCRTVNRVEGRRLVPVEGPEKCKAWDVVATETGAVWSVIDDEKRIEEGHFYADFGSGAEDLGIGSSGTLTWCGSAAYFARDPQTKADPAQLVRVDADGATPVYDAPGTGNAFLDAPRCGGRDVTVTAYSGAGDEQVTARVR